MPIVNPVPKESAAAELQDTYDNLTRMFGRMPNIFAVMAQRPAVLRNFLPFYTSIMAEGTVDARYKELAYLKAATINGCEY